MRDNLRKGEFIMKSIKVLFISLLSMVLLSCAHIDKKSCCSKDIKTEKNEAAAVLPGADQQGEAMGGFISTDTEKNHYQNKINTIDTQITSLESKINLARKRIQDYDKSAANSKKRSSYVIDVESEVSGIEAEIISLEAQKMSFEDLKNGINTDESIVR